MCSGAAEASLHFVGDANAAGGVDVIVDVSEITIWEDNAAANSLD